MMGPDLKFSYGIIVKLKKFCRLGVMIKLSGVISFFFLTMLYILLKAISIFVNDCELLCRIEFPQQWILRFTEIWFSSFFENHNVTIDF